MNSTTPVPNLSTHLAPSADLSAFDPQTDSRGETTSRIIALGTMGVITVGILAGLVLDWITPRRIL